jgi:hypothetical protein
MILVDGLPLPGFNAFCGMRQSSSRARPVTTSETATVLTAIASKSKEREEVDHDGTA